MPSRELRRAIQNNAPRDGLAVLINAAYELAIRACWFWTGLKPLPRC